MRAAIYIRVSTKLQEHKYSLKAQETELTRYCNVQQWEIAGIFRDVESGGKFDKKGLNALLDFVEEDRCDIVLCLDQDRLSRLDTTSWEYLKDILRENNVKIAEPGSITDLKNEDDVFISDIKNLIAQREKRAIVRRMMRGKRQRTREGKGWGKPPMEYLYDKNDGTYSINKEWAWVIPFIDDLYLNKSYSDQRIAHELNKICKTPKGKQWTDVHVKNKLTNKAYHGLMEKKFSNGEIIRKDDAYPKLRTEKDFERIQEKRKGKYRRRKMEHPQLLRKVAMTCSQCGKVLSVHMSGTKEYGLHFYIKHQKKETQNNCYVSINIERVEVNIIKAIKGIITSEEAAKKYIQLEYSEDDLHQLEKQVKDASKQIENVREKIDKLLPLYLERDWSKDQLDQMKSKLDAELKIHERNYKKIKAKRDLVKKNMFNYDMVLQYLVVAERFEVLLTKEEQMDMIGQLFPEAVVYDDHIQLRGALQNDVPLEVRVPIAPDPYENNASRFTREKTTKLDEEKVSEIRQLHKAGEKVIALAEKFGVSHATISRIINNQSWKHVEA